MTFLIRSGIRKNSEVFKRRNSCEFRYVIALSAFLVGTTCAPAAEVLSNGIGGGVWSEPATWRGKKAPGPGDDVIIQKNDIVLVDRKDDGKVSCGKLQIDPKGGLTYRPGSGKMVLAVADVIENYGVIRLDGTRHASDFFELRLVGDTAAKRNLKLMKGSALLLFGKSGKEKAPNVAISSPKVGEQKDDILGLVEAGAVSTLDVQRAQVNNVKLSGMNVDNTGAKANERFNIIDNHFTVQGRVYCHTCDTPIISRNSFDWAGEGQITEAAISLVVSPLGEVKDNTIRGNFASGIYLYSNTDTVVTGNTIERCGLGINNHVTINSMIKDCRIKGCADGVSFHTTTAVLENVLIEGATTWMNNYQSAVQLANVELKHRLPGQGKILQDGGSFTMLNCNIVPKQFKMVVPQAANPKNPPLTVIAMEYLIVGVKDAGPDALVEVRTVKPPLAADAADPNVRNAQAPLVKGLTPLPRTLLPIIVKSWAMDPKGALVPAPEYTIKIMGAAAKEGAPRPLLKSLSFRPTDTMFRPLPNDPAPTVEVPLK
jgi:parallel beta-helix repeat protein